MSTTDWIQVSANRKCPICDKPDWCGISADGNAAICMRCESSHATANGGWLHRLKETPRQPRKFITLPKMETSPAIDAAEIMRGFRAATPLEKIHAYAVELGVAPAPLEHMDVNFATEHNAWAWPMRCGNGDTIGIRLRNSIAEKWAIRGSKQGLFYPADPKYNRDDIAYVCEGPTDTAAALTLGLWAVGRAACRGQAEMLLTFFSHFGIRKVVVIADNDTPKDGPRGIWNPGIEGAEALVRELGLPWKILVPPEKDLRRWLQKGCTRETIAALESQHVWKEGRIKSCQAA